MKLILQIALLEHVLIVQVREQEDVNPVNPSTSLIFKSSRDHGFRLRISSVIESTENYLYLRGNSQTNPFQIVTRKYSNNIKRDAWIKRLKETLFDYATSIGARYNVHDLGHTQIITLNS